MDSHFSFIGESGVKAATPASRGFSHYNFKLQVQFPLKDSFCFFVKQVAWKRDMSTVDPLLLARKTGIGSRISHLEFNVKHKGSPQLQLHEGMSDFEINACFLHKWCTELRGLFKIAAMYLSERIAYHLKEKGR